MKSEVSTMVQNNTTVLYLINNGASIELTDQKNLRSDELGFTPRLNKSISKIPGNNQKNTGFFQTGAKNNLSKASGKNQLKSPYQSHKQGSKGVGSQLRNSEGGT